MIASEKYRYWLQQRREKKLSVLNDFWRWILHAFWHGILITFIVFHGYDTTFEVSTDDLGEGKLLKDVGQKDISTIIFNIVLHTIFLKLGFELERMSRAATLFIVITISFSYIVIAVAGSSGIALIIDPDLLGIG